MKLRTLWGVGAIAAAAMVVPQFAFGADHIDSARPMGEPLADINDVYAWMSADAANLNLALTVGGLSAPTQYDSSVVYVFHLSRGEAYGNTPTDSEIQCQFADEDTFECWHVADDGTVAAYVTGDTDVEAGVVGDEMRVFAGLRNDAFVFEFEGFTNAVNVTREAAPSLPPAAFDENGCVLLEGSAFDNNVGTTSAENDVVQLLTSSPPDGATGGDAMDPDNRIAADDTFAGLNSQTIVVQLPIDNVPGTGDIVAVWAATNRAE
ncbi:MAG: hypothetical protein AAGE52_26065 [Myxococcota bacterium]